MQMNSKSENQNISMYCLSDGTVDAEEIPGDAEGTMRKKGDMVRKKPDRLKWMLRSQIS